MSEALEFELGQEYVNRAGEICEFVGSYRNCNCVHRHVFKIKSSGNHVTVCKNGRRFCSHAEGDDTDIISKKNNLVLHEGVSYVTRDGRSGVYIGEINDYLYFKNYNSGLFFMVSSLLGKYPLGSGDDEIVARGIGD